MITRIRYDDNTLVGNLSTGSDGFFRRVSEISRFIACFEWGRQRRYSVRKLALAVIPLRLSKVFNGKECGFFNTYYARWKDDH